MSGTWRPLSSRRRIWRTSGPFFSCTRFSARRTVALRVAPGPWIGTATVWNSASGQASPLKPLCQVITATPRRARRLNSAGLQPSRSKTSVRAGSPASGAVRSGASGPSMPSFSSAGRMSASSAWVMVGSSALFRHRKGLPPSALIQ